MFVVALIPTFFITVISIVISFFYYLFSFNWQLGLSKLGDYFSAMALSIDQFANVSIQSPLRWLLIIDYKRKSKKFYDFGNEDDTVSYVIAMNKELKSLSKFGLFWAWFLDFVDTNHLGKTLENKRKKDLKK